MLDIFVGKFEPMETQNLERRVYPLDPRELTEEQLAVVFAMTSRNPKPFDEIAELVTEEKASDFHERWVLNYGHASVAEHAIIHMAIENISRLACDTLEDNRLASYTEKSSRYQSFNQGYYHIPIELKTGTLRNVYIDTCNHLFQAYKEISDKLKSYLEDHLPRRNEERDSSYNLRIHREATDTARFLLPSSALTNVGVTMNARSWEHAIRKLLSSELDEERDLGGLLKENGQKITPTLIKYADRNEYLVLSQNKATQYSPPVQDLEPSTDVKAELVHYDTEAEFKLASSLIYRGSSNRYQDIYQEVREMNRGDLETVIDKALANLGPHDIPLRELENVDYTFDLIMDYGAYREFKRHRMQTYIPQSLSVDVGCIVPDLISKAGLERQYKQAMDKSDYGFSQLKDFSPAVAQYVVTHGHLRRVISKMNLRECYHLFKLRTQPQAHFTIQKVISQAMELARDKHPFLFKYLKLRSS